MRIVVAVDPPVTSTAGSDSCGIIVAGLGIDRRAYVIADRTVQGREPTVWAKAAVAAYHDHEADTIVVETNQGGDLLVQMFKSIDARVPVKKVYASRGKYLRAEPVSGLYSEGRVAHVGDVPGTGAPDVRLRRRRPRPRQKPRPPRRPRLGHHRADAHQPRRAEDAHDVGLAPVRHRTVSRPRVCRSPGMPICARRLPRVTINRSSPESRPACGQERSTHTGRV